MKVAYQIRPLRNAEPAAALLLPGRRAEDVLRLCASLGLDPLPAIHRVVDGFLVKLPRPLEGPLAGVIRLRGLSANLLLPVDADLVPPLLPDEAAALVKQRGLVFLPGGRVLEYLPDQPLPLADLVRVGDVRRRSWQALPEVPELASEVTEIALEETDLPPDLLLEAGGEGIGDESPEIRDAGLPSKALAKTLFGLGKGMAWLGKSLNMPGLAGYGANMLAKAMSLVPKLSEELLGKQEAMLRNLLREFREGNIEKALKRALPLGDDSSRGNVAATNANLPIHNLYYSLVNLLGARGGPSSIWFGGGNTYWELQQEYRKQADQAAARGDFRRAAFIYAKLLRDFRSAAVVLARGGLHRDAAILYEKALSDPMSAAREWESAGAIDRALRIYIKLGEHALAGDLLRRAGEEERAVAEYQRAAAKLVETGHRHYEAGELMHNRAQRPDLALPYFRDGWQARPVGSPLPCALRLMKHHAAAGEGAPLLALVGEADTLLEPWDADSAATFYNELARLAERPKLAAVAADLRDRARLGLARKLARQNANRHGGNLIATLFPASSPWPAPLVRDADHASRQGLRRKPAAMPAPRSSGRVRESVVRAVLQLPVSKDVFLGLENGEVVCYKPLTGETITVAKEHGPILSLSAHCADDYLAVLSQAGPQRVSLSILSRSNGYRMLNYQNIAAEEPAWLCTGFADRSTRLVGVCVGRRFQFYRAPELVAQGALTPTRTEDHPVAAVLGPADNSSRGGSLLVLYPGHGECYPSLTSNAVVEFGMSWTPSFRDDDQLAQPYLHAVWNDGAAMELIGIDGQGSIRLSRLRPAAAVPIEKTLGWAGADCPCLTFARIRTDFVAGVTLRGIHWFHGTTQPPRAPFHAHRFTDPVAAFPLPAAGELLIIEADCSLTRIPIPE